MTVCGGWSLVKHDVSGTRAITLWCRSWQCADCMPFRLSALKRMATDGKPCTFMTLTVNPARGQDAATRALELTDAFRKLVKRARRKFVKEPLEYFAVFEETKKGEPHLHVLMRAPFIPQRWISETMAELCDAPIVDIRKVGSMRGVAKYVAKYVAKGPKSFGNLKRYWASPGYDLSEAKPECADPEWGSGWRVVKEPLVTIADSWRAFWRHVEWNGDHEIFSGHGREWSHGTT